MTNNQLEDFLGEYNDLLSTASLEHNGEFASMASPTLNKQETITFLFKEVATYLDNPNSFKRLKNKLSVWLMFSFRIVYFFLNLVVNSIRFHVNSIPENCVYIRTWLVPRSIKDGKVRDDYFSELIDDLKKNRPVVVGLHPLTFGKLLTTFKRTNKEENYIVPIGLLKIKDIFSLLVEYVSSAKIQLNQKYYYKGKEISFLINKSLKKDYYNFRSFQAYIDLYIARKIKQYHPKSVIYVFENQSWENAYLTTFKGSKTETIGYQSSGFTFRFLNFFPSKLDAKNALFPDKIFTVGELYSKLLKKHGNYPIPIKTFAALRFNYTHINGEYEIKSTERKIFQRILYAFPVHYYQYSRIIRDLIDVFGGSEIEVHLKFHPLFNIQIDKLGLPNNFVLWTSNKDKSLRELYDVVLFNDNSFGIESLIQGVKSYEYNFGELYPEARFIDFNCYDSLMQKDNLYTLKEELLTFAFKKKFDTKKVRDYINNCYKPYNNDLIKLI